MRPFFPYYGGKWRDALKHYPAPVHGTIIEPFAGAAGYALRYADRKVILCDKNPLIVQLWSYIIRVSPREILAIPDLPQGGTVDDMALCQEARWLVGFWLNVGVTAPRKAPSSWMRSGVRPGSFWGERVRAQLASQVDRVRHWRVFECDYADCPAVTGAVTWFIDPPYQGAGTHYKYGAAKLDYGELGRWCLSLSHTDQVIVCENAGATWLPFSLLGGVKTARKGRRSDEAVWVAGRQDMASAQTLLAI